MNFFREFHTRFHPLNEENVAVQSGSSSDSEHTRQNESNEKQHIYKMRPFRRFRKRFLHPQEENVAMVTLERAIIELADALSERGTPKEKIKDIKIQISQCFFANALRDCIGVTTSEYRNDLELAGLICDSIAAMISFHDLRYERALADHERAVASGRWPAWIMEFKQQKVKRYGKIFKVCIKWLRVWQMMRFQLILKQDERLYHQKSEDRDMTTAFVKKRHPKLPSKQARLPALPRTLLSAIAEEGEETEEACESEEKEVCEPQKQPKAVTQTTQSNVKA